LNPQFWRNSYGYTIGQIFDAVKKRCDWYTPVPEVLQLLPKLPDETYDDYLSRHLLEAHRLHVSYNDKALCALIPPELQYLVEEE